MNSIAMAICPATSNSPDSSEFLNYDEFSTYSKLISYTYDEFPSCDEFAGTMNSLATANYPAIHSELPS
jgi:hypothetical protein